MRVWGKGWRDNLALWIPVLTFAVLAINPVPECVHCEEWPNPWGRDDVAYMRDSTLLNVWFIGASCAVGLFGLKWSWLAPVGILAAHVVTQPIGGVSLSSLSHNEAPVIMLLGIPVGYASLGLGWLTRLVVNRFTNPTWPY